ncbi:MAG: TetR/AcrR family transcriptional regulator [Clostridia bacterium]|nr:TetR/AcrR family transcriptional regulator [Clostridia bacterium]MBQ9306547.1 TetR/AcrR family transcriptional regulator [Clostridia bacterium]MBR1684767.1 TetR/AcrR family transcriptional regulator [Clostridia bacterium]MBR2288054.1 TetR/AcrR family transcriptional regulator [Clostridia bacterium]
MPRDKTASHVRILAAARDEFLAHGFEKASMRRIGERCGMTAAGIYRHCTDKADLFNQVAEPAVRRLKEWLDAHVSRYVSAAQSGTIAWQDSEIDMMREVVYPHMEEYRLLLTCAQGTRYAHFLHDLTQTAQCQLTEYFSLLSSRGHPVREISPQEMHLLMSAYTTALFEPVVHGYSPEEALRCLDTVETFFLPGWKALLGF